MTADEAIQRTFNFHGRNRNLPWYPRKGTREDLARLFGALDFRYGVEIGTQKGFYARVLCRENPRLSLTCVDPWAPYGIGQVFSISGELQEARHQETLRRLAGLSVTYIRKPSLDAVKMFDDEYLDFVYIDGNHLFDFVMRDIIEWAPKVRMEGIIAVHDYHAEVGADVMQAVNAYTHSHGIDPWYVTRERLPTAYWVRRPDEKPLKRYRRENRLARWGT